MKRILIIVAIFCCIDLFAARSETTDASSPYTVAGSYKFLALRETVWELDKCDIIWL